MVRRDLDPNRADEQGETTTWGSSVWIAGGIVALLLALPTLLARSNLRSMLARSPTTTPFVTATLRLTPTPDGSPTPMSATMPALLGLEFPTGTVGPTITMIPPSSGGPARATPGPSPTP